jgi:hypothetical protein
LLETADRSGSMHCGPFEPILGLKAENIPRNALRKSEE